MEGEIEGAEADISFYTALHSTLCVLTNRNLAVPKLIVKSKAAVDAHWVCIDTPVIGVLLYISAWASALLVLTIRACQSLDSWDG